MKQNYKDKFTSIQNQTILSLLSTENQTFIKSIAFEFLFTLSELRILSEISKDLEMWNEISIIDLWKQSLKKNNSATIQKKQLKEKNLKFIVTEYEKIKSKEKQYLFKNSITTHKEYIHRNKNKKQITVKKTSADVFGTCPVFSEKTVCCNLRTIDAVNNCGMGCTYCCIQTFFPDKKITFDSKLKEKLEAIELDPNHFYHIGTGQSSDSLMWGNKFNLLDDLMDFAHKRKNIWLEFKTKTNRVEYFLEQNNLPKNIVCSWSLNPDTIINNEEHFTASLDKRLEAAKKVVQKGIKIGFHLHPIVYYHNWKNEYKEMIQKIISQFDSKDILFISMGTLTFAKPIIKEIRTLNIPTKILQMPFSPNPEKKMTYPDEIKYELFETIYNNFSLWHDKVYFYFCMEEEKFWHKVFHFCYKDNLEFENDFNSHVKKKLNL